MAGYNQSLRCQPLLGWLFDSRAPALGAFTPTAPGAHWGQEGGSSLQLRPPSPQNPIANLRLESRVTRSKQTVAPSSNREKFQAVPMNLSTSFPSPAATRPLSRADALSCSLHSDSLHCRCDTCNISPSKSCSGVHFVQQSGHVIAKHHALLIVREASDPNQTARGRRMKK